MLVLIGKTNVDSHTRSELCLYLLNFLRSSSAIQVFLREGGKVHGLIDEYGQV